MRGLCVPRAQPDRHADPGVRHPKQPGERDDHEVAERPRLHPGREEAEHGHDDRCERHAADAVGDEPPEHDRQPRHRREQQLVEVAALDVLHNRHARDGRRAGDALRDGDRQLEGLVVLDAQRGGRDVADGPDGDEEEEQRDEEVAHLDARLPDRLAHRPPRELIRPEYKRGHRASSSPAPGGRTSASTSRCRPVVRRNTSSSVGCASVTSRTSSPASCTSVTRRAIARLPSVM